jgi:ATP-dependent 26S proteasome regulatory subunit
VCSSDLENIDKALVRPGRIDLRVDMKNASIQTIKDMYLHYYGTKIPRQYNNILKDDVISPAEIVNMYRTTNSSKEFIETMVLKFQSS